MILNVNKTPTVNVLKFGTNSNKMSYANNADPDQTVLKSDRGLHCCPFH